MDRSILVLNSEVSENFSFEVKIRASITITAFNVIYTIMKDYYTIMKDKSHTEIGIYIPRIFSQGSLDEKKFQTFTELWWW